MYVNSTKTATTITAPWILAKIIIWRCNVVFICWVNRRKNFLYFFYWNNVVNRHCSRFQLFYIGNWAVQCWALSCYGPSVCVCAIFYCSCETYLRYLVKPSNSEQWKQQSWTLCWRDCNDYNYRTARYNVKMFHYLLLLKYPVRM